MDVIHWFVEVIQYGNKYHFEKHTELDNIGKKPETHDIRIHNCIEEISGI